jgi:hypothetical protein
VGGQPWPGHQAHTRMDGRPQGLEWLGLGVTYHTLSKMNPVFSPFCVTVLCKELKEAGRGCVTGLKVELGRGEDNGKPRKNKEQKT